jgi:HD-GYP domain-containing protein (c-di-GMP phosphodiesterase class II)
MLLVPTGQLQPGMVLAQPVIHPASREIILLQAGFSLDRETINRLKDFNLTHLWVKFPDLEELQTVPNERISRGHTVLYEAINTSIERLEPRVAIKTNLHRIKRAIGQMMTEILISPNHAVITHQLASCSPQVAGHLANCCYLSLLVGAHMSGYLQTERSTLPPKVAENTSQLGLGALLHDIGKLNMLDDLQRVSVIDPESEWVEYRAHVRAGFELIHDQVSVLAANVVLNHHQRFDGRGFPLREDRARRQPPAPLKGPEIHIFSRIVAVVDAFDHLLCPQGHAVPTIVAVHHLKSDRYQGWFDPVVMETLLRLVPPFMVGSLLTLSDGTEAVVVDNHPEAPCRPSVKLLSGPLCSRSTRIRGRTLDLRMCREPAIASVDKFDVRPYLFKGELEPELTGVW